MRRAWLTLVCWLVLLIAARENVPAATVQSLWPNVVIILSDDMGRGAVAVLNRDSRIPRPIWTGWQNKA